MRCRIPLARMSLLCLADVLVATVSSRPALAEAEFRAVWADAFREGFKSPSEVDDLIMRCIQGRYNAIIAEVLAFHSTGANGHGAYWNSSIVPKASDISSGFDPLAYLCQQAHANGIEVHAWLVAFRVSTTWPPPGNAFLGARPHWLMVRHGDIGNVVPFGGAYTFDPGSPEVQDYLIDIVRELVTDYPIDGINWDYIRHVTHTDGGYPAVTTNNPLSGMERFKRIHGVGGTPAPDNADWQNFRRRSINEIIRRTRAEIPWIRTNPRQPLWHTADVIAFGNAPTTCGGFNTTSAYILYQDWRHWMQEGWLDAAIPMNYKREHCSGQDTMYRNWVDRSLDCWRYNRLIFNGQGNYLNSFENSVAQMAYARNQGTDGLVNFSYFATRSNNANCDGNDAWSNDWSWYPYIGNNLFTSTAPTPSMPWRDPATATEGTIWGRVTDHATGDPVDDANVVVGNPFGANKSARTDGSGYYVVTLMPATAQGVSYAVTASKSGLPGASTPAALMIAGDVTRYDFALGAPASEITVIPSSLAPMGEAGSNAGDDTLTLGTVGGSATAPLNFTTSVSAGWLSVTPRQGTLSSGSVELEVLYDTAGLGEGVHLANITITDAAASNSPLTVPVQLTVGEAPIPGDFDLDGDVDMNDYAFLQNCLTGNLMGPPAPGCEPADLDNDLDVDDADVARFINCMSGSHVPGDSSCND